MEIQVSDEANSVFFKLENNYLNFETFQFYFSGARGLVFGGNPKICVPIINDQFQLRHDVLEYNVLYKTRKITDESRDQLIMNYFQSLYTYKEIRHLLAVKHNYHISERSLKRILKGLGVRRKNIVESETELIVKALIEIHSTSGFNLGYRSLWQRLKTECKLTMKRDTILKYLRIIDPEGIEARSRYRLKRRQYSLSGPNHLWHVDGHDKLKKFGFAIHGCVDGYSRKVIWLNVATINNKPEVIAYYYLQSSISHNCVPCVIRSDKGTENF
ncbi:uncharacterized protein LOC106659200 [Trichogramma pretiosum]|uniref:uncharacterized protein LOC106659200 n=1 Tax=Trichogramma pretiosum TaxID=7493 RepID=UPI0006C9A964|nr:uncharacterized protein LOC106659200 [Trichogramma pretiosum]